MKTSLPLPPALLTLALLCLPLAGARGADADFLDKPEDAATALFVLAKKYYNGDGVQENLAESARLMRKGSELRYTWGQWVAQGDKYSSGQGVRQDYAEAVEWYRKAAEQGNAAGQRNLGLSYATGRGVTQNHQLATIWMQRAALRGNADAIKWLKDNGEAGTTRTAARTPSPSQPAAPRETQVAPAPSQLQVAAAAAPAAPAARREHTYYTYFHASKGMPGGENILNAFSPVIAFKDAPQKYSPNDWALLTPDDSERFAQVRAKWQAALQTALQREARSRFGASVGQVQARTPLGPPSSDPHEQQFLRRQPFQPREGREMLDGGNEGEFFPSRADADYVRNVHKLRAENIVNQSIKVHVIEVDETGRSTPWPYSRNAVAHAGNAGAVEMAESGGGGAAEGGVQGLLRQFSALAQVSAEGSDAMAGYWKSTTGREQYFIMGGSTGYNISPTYVDGAHSVILILPIAYSYDSGANVWSYRMTEGAYAIGSKEPVNRASTQTYRVQPQWIGGGRSAFQVNQLRLEKMSATEWSQKHKEMLDRQLRLNGLNPIEFNNVKAGGGQPVRGSAPGSFQRK